MLYVDELSQRHVVTNGISVGPVFKLHEVNTEDDVGTQMCFIVL